MLPEETETTFLVARPWLQRLPTQFESRVAREAARIAAAANDPWRGEPETESRSLSQIRHDANSGDNNG